MEITAPETVPHDRPPRPDRPGSIEAHGIDMIGPDERHGRARDLFGVWAAPNVSYLALVVGGALILMGLNLWQAIGVIVAGNLLSAGVGLLAVSGPASGTPSEVIMRAMFGIRGNRVNIALTGWLVSVCYLALNWAAASLAAFAVADRLGITVTTPVKIALILLIAAITLTISVYGHATIVRLYTPLTVVLTVVFTVLAAYVIGHADWSYQPRETLHGTSLWAVITAGLALVASGPLSYSNSADFARYLPADTSPVAVASWTAIGSFVPSVLFTSIGALAGTAIDMTDPQTSLGEVLPAWFMPVFLIAVVVGTIANNAMTAYSSGLALQAIGIRLRRSVTVLLDGTVGVLMTLYALLVSNFLDTVSSWLQFLVAVLGPVMAIYATDILMRRNRYDGVQLSDETASSEHWYHWGINWAGAIALVVGSAAALACIHTETFEGVVSTWIGGIDLSLPVGVIVAALVYGILSTVLYGRSSD